MSVLIKGMGMPDRCDNCPFSNFHLVDKIECVLLEAETFTWNLGLWGGQEPKKFDGCPLVEVPTPHGSLIDADEYEHLLRKTGNRDYRREKGTINDAIKFLHPHYTPTIIEAEE